MGRQRPRGDHLPLICNPGSEILMPKARPLCSAILSLVLLYPVRCKPSSLTGLFLAALTLQQGTPTLYSEGPLVFAVVGKTNTSPFALSFACCPRKTFWSVVGKGPTVTCNYSESLLCTWHSPGASSEWSRETRARVCPPRALSCCGSQHRACSLLQLSSSSFSQNMHSTIFK